MTDVRRTAACDRHLPDALRKLPILGNQTVQLQVLHLEQADEHYMCACRVPAHWYVRQVVNPSLVYVGDDKGDITIFATPIAAVRYRIEAMYQHLGEPEVLAQAQAIVESGDQQQALRFLQKRDGGEYEGIVRVDIIE